MPDRIVLLPGGRIVFVELKRPKGGVLDKRQKWWADTLVRLGFQYWQVWDDADLEMFELCELINGGGTE